LPHEGDWLAPFRLVHFDAIKSPLNKNNVIARSSKRDARARRYQGFINKTAQANMFIPRWKRTSALAMQKMFRHFTMVDGGIQLHSLAIEEPNRLEVPKSNEFK